jgi:hypothetical protein
MIGEWLNENTITGMASHRVCRKAEADGTCGGVEDAAGPVRHQVQGQQRQGDDERVDQQAHDLDRGLLAAAHDRQQAEDQHERQDRPRRRRDVQLVLHEAADGVGQATL